jgi:ABC-type branched-subunit amino acid transport system substrate-binding protein
MKIAMSSIETLSKILATLVILLVSTTPSRADDARHNDRIPVGVILSLTGELSPFGEALRQGIELAHADGGIKEVSFSYEDDGSVNRAMTVGALQSLIKREHIKIAVVTGITTLVPIDPIVRKEGLLALSAFDSNAMIDTLSDSSFGYGWSNELTGEKMSRSNSSAIKLKGCT